MILLPDQERSFDPSYFALPVHIIGCGGMGSRIAEGLVRMGVGRAQSPIHLYDHDVFEAKNLRNQFITRWSVGHAKVEGLAKELRRIEPHVQIRQHFEQVQFKDHHELQGVVFLCLDSMEARKEIVFYSLHGNPHVRCVIETRVDAGVGVSYCFEPANELHMDCWWLYWHPDGEAENTIGCGGGQPIIKAIYGTSMIALSQFEQFSKKRTAIGLPNRVYADFDFFETHPEVWPAAA